MCLRLVFLFYAACGFNLLLALHLTCNSHYHAVCQLHSTCLYRDSPYKMNTVMKLVTAATTGLEGSYWELVVQGARYQLCTTHGWV
jgi:hypothetical protein